MKLKTTKRINGKMAITLQIDFNIYIDDLIEAVTHHSVFMQNDIPCSRKEAIDIVINYIKYHKEHNQDSDYSDEDLPIIENVEQRIKYLFPEMINN